MGSISRNQKPGEKNLRIEWVIQKIPYKPYDKSHMIWAIWYESYDMSHKSQSECNISIFKNISQSRKMVWMVTSVVLETSEN